MRSVVQRVLRASVEVDGQEVACIGRGLLVLVAAMAGDAEDEADRLARKIVDLRIFEGPAGRMDQSLREVDGSMLVVSQFTLAAGVRKGRRPEFTRAAPPEQAEALVAGFVRRVAALGITVRTGVFRAHMQVSLVNDGPVTIVIDTDLFKVSRREAKRA